MRKRRAFLDSVRHRLLKINVFARRQRIHRHAHMPMIRRSNNHRVDLLLQHFAIIHVRSRHAVGAQLYSVASRPIHIAHRHDLVAARLVSRIEQVAHAPARSQHSDTQSVVRPKHAR